MINESSRGRSEESRAASGRLRQFTSSIVGAVSSNLILRHPSRGQRIYRITQIIILFSLVLYALFAPHSIAITQTSYLIGLVAWGVQIVATREFRQQRSPVDIALFGFFACCVVSSFLSYDLLVSTKGLKSPAFFLAFYFVSTNVKSLRFASFLVLALIISCLVNVGYSAVTLGVGRGLRIDAISPDSPFTGEGINVGDVILEADDTRVNKPDDLLRIIDSQRGRMRIKIQRAEAITETSIARQAIKEAEGSGFERLGITTSPGRNFRIMGFYSHYETYAEVLQLIAAMAVGLLVAIPGKRSWPALLLWLVIPTLVVTLIMTSTRAALIGLAVAVAVIAISNSRRRVAVFAMSAIVITLPLALVAVEHARGISVFDPEESSTAWRLEVWREAFAIIKNHPLVGIGKGSEGKLKSTLGLYDKGRLPPGHFHSTPVQIAVWWGLLALIFYCSFMTILVAEAWRLIKKAKARAEWQLSGIALGGLGAVMAFNVSSGVHFNFGDGEVVMVFWLVTGLVFAVRRIALQEHAASSKEYKPAPQSPDNSSRNQLPQQATAVESSVRAARAKRD